MIAIFAVAVTIGLLCMIGICITSHLNILDKDEWQ
jgi:hypothetical protein